MEFDGAYKRRRLKKARRLPGRNTIEAIYMGNVYLMNVVTHNEITLI